MSDIRILKDEQHQLITVQVGNSTATVTLGEWSKLTAQPRMYRPAEVFAAPDKDSA